jgi:hypothetical protein
MARLIESKTLAICTKHRISPPPDSVDPKSRACLWSLRKRSSSHHPWLALGFNFPSEPTSADNILWGLAPLMPRERLYEQNGVP